MLRAMYSAKIVKKAKIPNLEILISEAVEEVQNEEPSKMFGNAEAAKNQSVSKNRFLTRFRAHQFYPE